MEQFDRCFLCKGKHLEYYISAKDNLVSEKTFTVVQCATCGFVITNPRPYKEDLGKYYLSDEYVSHNDAADSLIDKVYKVVRKFMLGRKVHLILNNVARNHAPIRLLDYGCATGEFLLRAQMKNIDGIGVEPDDAARSKARSKGITVTDDVEKILNEEGFKPFDVVTLWHVLEHVPDLPEKTRNFSQLVDKKGLLVIAVPEYKSFDAQFYGENWAAWDLPRHLNHFEEKTIVQWVGKEFLLETKIPLLFDSFYISLLSEKAKESGVFGSLRALLIGFWSNVSAFMGKNPYSSQIYVFRKL